MQSFGFNLRQLQAVGILSSKTGFGLACFLFGSLVASTGFAATTEEIFLQGKSLFNDSRYCVQCHTAAQKTGRSAAQISSAISRIGSMSYLNVLTPSEISAISSYLANPNAVFPVADTQAPTVPNGLSATAASSSQINLGWTAASDNVGVTSYKLFRGGTQIVTLGNVLVYTDTGLAGSTLNSYTVTACDAAANCSAQSASASTTTLPAADTIAPTVPTGLQAAVISSTQIMVSWTNATDNVGVSNYQVFRDQIRVGNSATNAYNDIALTPATAYNYAVAACDGAGNCSALSAITSAVTPAVILTNPHAKDDCLFNWAAAAYPQFFAPGGGLSQNVEPYYVRFFTQTSSYLGVSADTSRLYYLGPLSNGVVTDLGDAAQWYSQAGCR